MVEPRVFNSLSCLLVVCLRKAKCDFQLRRSSKTRPKIRILWTYWWQLWWSSKGGLSGHFFYEKRTHLLFCMGNLELVRKPQLCSFWRAGCKSFAMVFSQVVVKGWKYYLRLVKRELHSKQNLEVSNFVEFSEKKTNHWQAQQVSHAFFKSKNMAKTFWLDAITGWISDSRLTRLSKFDGSLRKPLGVGKRGLLVSIYYIKQLLTIFSKIFHNVEANE